MAVKTNGFNTKTAERLLLDAGAIYKNLIKDEESGEFTGVALGATGGGNEFVVTVETRQPEIDGAKGRIKGLEFITAHDANLTVNLKELTAENLKIAIGAADLDDKDTNYDIIRPRKQFKDEDYLENIAYVGRLAGSQKPVVIILKNALSVEGFTMSSEEDNEAVVPINFYAHADMEDIEKERPAYEIYWPKETAEA